MNNEIVPGTLYLLFAGMLLIGILVGRREPWARKASALLLWSGIFASGFLLFSFRDDLGYVAQRLHSEATGVPVSEGRTVRVPMAVDGHFWVDAEVNGRPVKFLVDSGATMTTVDRDLAAGLGVKISRGRDQMVRTGNGIIRVYSGRARTVRIATITRANVGMHVAENDDLNVLGMNFLSSLRRWGVEGRWLVLEG